MDKIDLTPTPDGVRFSIRLFEDQIHRSEHLIKVAEEWLELMEIERRVYVSPDEFHIFEAALEALQEQERQRIGHMRDGIVSARGEPATPALVPADSLFIDAAVQEYQREGFIDVDTEKAEVSRGEAGVYVKAWLFVEYPTCGAAIGIHECVRRLGHEGQHACDSECDLGHLREDELAAESGP